MTFGHQWLLDITTPVGSRERPRVANLAEEYLHQYLHIICGTFGWHFEVEWFG